MGSQELPTVLIVVEEPVQRSVLGYNLEAEGFLVTTASNSEEAMMLVDKIRPDIIVLAWKLANVLGIEVCRRLKSRADTRLIPIIMLSSRPEEVDQVRGLETGADDYVIKPYIMVELMARVHAQLRRVRPSLLGGVLEWGDIRLEPETHRVFRAGNVLKLGPTEFHLLTTFMKKPGRVWSREQLLDEVLGRDIYVDIRAVDVLYQSPTQGAMHLRRRRPPAHRSRGWLCARVSGGHYLTLSLLC